MDDRTQEGPLHTTDEANYFARDFAERSERAAQANVKIVADQAEVLRHMWQTSAEMASNLTTRSADQVARTFGIGGDEAENAAGQATGNIGALVQSASVVSDAARAISTELVDLVRHSTERSINYMGAIARCRSPQDFVSAQANAMRDNLEMLMNSSRRITEIALQTAQESSHVVGQSHKPIRSAD